MLLDDFGDFLDLSDAVGIDEPKPFDLVVDSLGGELAETVDGLKFSQCNSGVGVDVKEIQDGDEDALPHQHVGLGGVLLHRTVLPFVGVTVLLRELQPTELFLQLLILVQLIGREVTALHSVGVNH